MSHNANTYESFEIEPVAGRTWNWYVPWWLLAALAFALIELKAKPAVGVIVLCLRFGFNDWRTAGWLCRTDPQPQRARTIWWFLVGSGLLRIFVIAVLVYPLLCAICAGLGFKPTRQEVRVSITLGLIGILLSLVVTHIGALLANRRGVKVWINRQLHVSRDRNEWPPYLDSPNQLKSIIGASSLPAIGAAMFGLLVLIGGTIAQQLPVAMIGSLMTVVSAIILINHQVLLRRIVAKSPDECWRTWQPPTWRDEPTFELTEDDVIA